MKKIIFFFVCIIFLVFLRFNSNAQLISDTATIRHMNKMFLITKELAKNRADKLYGVFKQSLTDDEKQALIFLFAYMPLSDLADYEGQFFFDNVKMSLKARSEMPWGKDIPEDVFLHFVLPVRMNNENIDSFRIVMYDELQKRVSGLSMKEAALKVNHWCHEKVTYKASDERTTSPLNTIKYSFGRCGEEAVFTVSAMRAVGIPARQVYTPLWAHTDDNHAWVEVWIDGKWYFLGACEPAPDLNMGWFANPAARAMLVLTRAYGWYHGSEPVIAQGENYSDLNLIFNYAPVKDFVVKVTDASGKAVNNAKVEYQLYNYAEFYPIAKTYTDTNGITGLTCGLGDLLIWANKGEAYGYKKITVENTDTVIIQIKVLKSGDIPKEFDMIPPVERSVAVATEKGAQENSKKMQIEDSLRALYMTTFKDSTWVIGFAKKNNISEDTALSVIIKSYGNWKEVTSFIENTPVNMRSWALRLLSVISEKDLRDVNASVLSDHLDNAFKYDNGFAASNPDFFAKYVLSGRISAEWMKGWRAYLQSKWDTAFVIRAQNDISMITNWINNNISVNDTSKLYSGPVLTPIGLFELKAGGSKSRDIFFVALCRSLNIPSRLNPETLVPQFWNGSDWKNVLFGRSEQVSEANGYIHLVSGNSGIEFKYSQNFTITYFKNGVYRALQFDENKSMKDFPKKIEAENGKYMLVTGNRMNDGSVLSSLYFFNVYEGKTTKVTVKVREKITSEKPWGKIDTASFTLNGFTDNKKYKLSELLKKNGAVMVFIDPDKEPSKHVLVDIAAVKESFEKWGGSVTFIIPQNKISSFFSLSDFKGLPLQSIFAVDKDEALFRAIGKQKCYSLENKYPVIISADKEGNMYYYSEGYRIGAGEQLVKIIMRKNK